MATGRAEYHLCCGGGKIYLPLQPNPPIGSLCPEEGHHPQFLQLYIYDTQDEVANRMRNFIGHDEDTLNPEIVEGLIHVLDEHNSLVRLFRTVQNRCSASEIPGFKIRLYNKGGICGYELPTSDILGGIVFEDGPNSRTNFDIIIEFRGGSPQRINKLHQSYMSLQFHLLFIFGQPGFYPDLVLKPRDGRGKGKKVSMNTYYKYQLHWKRIFKKRNKKKDKNKQIQAQGGKGKVKSQAN
ncbi:hypothetical protein Tco_1494819 [Tanacetum coccineum]